MQRNTWMARNFLAAALFLLWAVAAAAADSPYSKFGEQFSRWKSHPQPGAYDRIVAGGPDGSTLVSFPHGGGLMRSFDGGVTWQALTVDGQGAQDVAIAPRDSRLWYAYGGQDKTLHRTIDGGNTWSTRGDALATDRQAFGVAISADPSVIYRTLGEIDLDCDFNECAFKTATLQRSTDAGASWRDIGSPQDFQRAYPSPLDPELVFALGKNGFQRSLDQGTTWTTVSVPGISQSLLGAALALDRSDPAIAYFVVNPANGLPASVYSTRDGGASWTATSLPDGRVFADGAQKGRAWLFTTFFGAYETRDAGLTWVKVEPSVYTSVNANVGGVVLRSGRRFAVGPYFDTLRELDLDDGALALASDLWWNPGESGWGITITHRASTQTFVTWYAYDAAGNPVWRVIPGGTWSDRTFSGDLYETTASRYFGSGFDPSTVTRRKVGAAQISFDSENRAVFSYQLASGDSGSKLIERQLFGPPVAVPAVQESYADLWWNAAESGWGIAINHQDDNIFATWFAYDDAGRPLWLVMPDAKVAVVAGVPTATGDVYTTRGPGSSAPFDPSQVVRTRVGTASLAFTTSDQAVLSSTVFGLAERRVITRQPF
jgi:YD repeat-containing protein